MTSELDPDDPAEAIEPAEAMHIYRDGTVRARSATVGVSRLMMAIWGVTWLIGYFCMWLGSQARDGEPATWSYAVFFALLMLAAVTSTAVGVRTSKRQGVVGPTALTGALFGWSWFVAFGGGMAMTGVIVARYDLSGAVIAVLYNSIAALIVGSLYMAGAAAFREPPMFVIGAVFVVLGLVGALVGVPSGYLVMALAGGGLMLVGVLVETLRVRRSVAL